MSRGREATKCPRHFSPAARSRSRFSAPAPCPDAWTKARPSKAPPWSPRGLASLATPATEQVREIDLHFPLGEIQPREGQRLLVLSFATEEGGAAVVPSPEIRVTEGDTVRVNFHRSGMARTIHWHGVRLPWSMDGVPFMTEDPREESITNEFVARDPGTYWYHCHVDAPVHGPRPEA